MRAPHRSTSRRASSGNSSYCSAYHLPELVLPAGTRAHQHVHLGAVRRKARPRRRAGDGFPLRARRRLLRGRGRRLRRHLRPVLRQPRRRSPVALHPHRHDARTGGRLGDLDCRRGLRSPHPRLHGHALRPHDRGSPLCPLLRGRDGVLARAQHGVCALTLRGRYPHARPDHRERLRHQRCARHPVRRRASS